jgi:ubiquinone/menaquinone biosynthesis C-methylase UbiE
MSKPYLGGHRLLDYGCGNGANTLLFEPDFRQIVGIEVEEDRLNEAKDYASRNGHRIEYEIYDGGKLPFSDESFDRVVSFEVLEHTRDDQEAAKEVYRVLANGGLFILTVPNKWYLMETHGLNLPMQNVVKWHRVPFMSWLPGPIHSRYAKARIYTRKNIESKLRRAGFKVEAHQYLQAPFDKISNVPLRRVLQNVSKGVDNSPLRCIGVSHFIVARKGS